jgi:hypothetical protein
LKEIKGMADDSKEEGNGMKPKKNQYNINRYSNERNPRSKERDLCGKNKIQICSSGTKSDRIPRRRSGFAIQHSGDKYERTVSENHT